MNICIDRLRSMMIGSVFGHIVGNRLNGIVEIEFEMIERAYYNMDITQDH